MRSSSILGILGIVFGLLGAIFVLFFSALVASAGVNAVVGILASLLGIVAIWLSNKDSKIAAVQYIIVGFGVLIAIGFFGVLGFIFFIIAAILVFRDKKVAVPIREVE